MLRRRQRELEQMVGAARSPASPLAGQPSSGVTARQNRPAPFQVQLVADEAGQDTESMTNNASGGTLQVQKTPLLDHTAIRSVNITKNAASGAPEIDVEFSQEGKELFAAVTRENINKRLAIVLDGQVYSAPVIRSKYPEEEPRLPATSPRRRRKSLRPGLTTRSAASDLQT